MNWERQEDTIQTWVKLPSQVSTAGGGNHPQASRSHQGKPATLGQQRTVRLGMGDRKIFHKKARTGGGGGDLLPCKLREYFSRQSLSLTTLLLILPKPGLRWPGHCLVLDCIMGVIFLFGFHLYRA